MGTGRVHVVGSVNVDVALPVERLPRPGETILSGDPVRSGGGKGANTAVAAARDGADVRLVAAVGRDDEAEQSLSELVADGVGTDHVAREDAPTGLAMICVDAAGENFIVVAAGANDALTPESVTAGLDGATDGDVCVVNFEIPEAAVVRAVTEATARGARALVNPSPVRELAPELARAGATLVLNAGELRALTEREDIGEGARACLDGGFAAVVTTLGADGARVVTADEDETVPAFPADAVDTTGAGDTFTGVLAAALARGEALVPAARRAAAAAARSTEGPGARGAMPRTDAIDALLAAS